VLGGLGVVALVYLMIAMAARPTFRPHWNRDEPQKPPESLAINYELRFHSKLTDVQDRLETDGTSLIVRKTKQ
jgi:hypothetical protein